MEITAGMAEAGAAGGAAAVAAAAVTGEAAAVHSYGNTGINPGDLTAGRLRSRAVRGS